MGTATASRNIATIALITLGALPVVMTLAAPDDGPDLARALQGLVLGLVLVSAPGALYTRPTGEGFVGLGGGMAMAGVITTTGGNVFGAIMGMVGIALFIVGVSKRPPLSPPIVLTILATAAALSFAMYLALVSGLASLAAIGLAALVALSPRWTRSRVVEV